MSANDANDANKNEKNIVPPSFLFVCIRVICVALTI